jgi:hypothetical protein
MIELISLLFIYVVFLLASIFLYRKAYFVKGPILYFYILVYFCLIEAYFRGITQLQIYLLERDVEIDFGHASLSLVLLSFVTYFTGLIFVIVRLVKRRG